MIIDAIVTKAIRIFKSLLKPHKETTKTKKRSLNSFEMSSKITIGNFGRLGHVEDIADERSGGIY
ncbi:MAG: hypothetical protein MRT15_12565 [archaeon YNP-LCB-003-016]|jgi:hypothetical protein|uniref:hypothetical protein n=1 Tax=Candidatus Culexarchaeum yellowstonense TaxID=2928963 RepID=UPI0026EC732C|nr:hypothetical protein [Candidatus Culexarchaeum yellowstonense]MCR6693221.1 hypothetical protein [Candidatus Culexarchaeum yellowstonense]